VLLFKKAELYQPGGCSSCRRFFKKYANSSRIRSKALEILEANPNPVEAPLLILS
jgi:hypothetical protein